MALHSTPPLQVPLPVPGPLPCQRAFLSPPHTKDKGDLNPLQRCGPQALWVPLLHCSVVRDEDWPACGVLDSSRCTERLCPAFPPDLLHCPSGGHCHPCALRGLCPSSAVCPSQHPISTGAYPLHLSLALTTSSPPRSLGVPHAKSWGSSGPTGYSTYAPCRLLGTPPFPGLSLLPTCGSVFPSPAHCTSA